MMPGSRLEGSATGVPISTFRVCHLPSATARPFSLPDGIPEQHTGAVHALEYGFAGPDIRRPASGARIADAPSEKGT